MPPRIRLLHSGLVRSRPGAPATAPVTDAEFGAACRQLGIRPDARVAVAFSGGVDSTALCWLAVSRPSSGSRPPLPIEPRGPPVGSQHIQASPPHLERLTSGRNQPRSQFILWPPLAATSLHVPLPYGCVGRSTRPGALCRWSIGRLCAHGGSRRRSALDDDPPHVPPPRALPRRRRRVGSSAVRPPSPLTMGSGQRPPPRRQRPQRWRPPRPT